MREDKKEAQKLRNRGHSYSRISAALGIPKSTLSDWFSGEEWSLPIAQRLHEKNKVVARENIRAIHVSRQLKLEALYTKALEESEREYLLYQHDPLFLAGIMLYWGEGDKKFENGRVKVSYTDPGILKIFRNFLIQFCGYSLEDIKGWILLYPDLKPENCLKYWSEEAGILRGNFIKSTIIQGRHPNHRLKYGTCTVHVTNKYLKKKILRWIDLYRKNLVKL